MEKVEQLQNVHEVEFDQASGIIAATTFRQTRIGKKQFHASDFDLHISRDTDAWKTLAFNVRKFEWGSLPTSKIYKEPHLHMPRLFVMVQTSFGAELQVFLGYDSEEKRTIESRVADFYLKQNTQLIIAVERPLGGRKNRSVNHSLIVYDLNQDLRKSIHGRSIYFAKN